MLIPTIFLTLLIVSQCNNPCVTGYKILVRQTIYHNPQNQPQTKSYNLKYKCLCPADYFGSECGNHVSLYCFLQPLKNINILPEITQQNYQNLMNFTLNFTSECYIDHYENKNQMIKLKDYLRKYNKQNKYGIQKQFGEENQIIWANTTQIFDKNHEFKLISEYNQAKIKYEQQLNRQQQNNQTTSNTTTPLPMVPTPQQLHTLIIGSNIDLYTTPFTYPQNFLSYPLSHSKITINIQSINPQHGVKKYLSLELKDINIDDKKLEEYLYEKQKSEELKDRINQRINSNSNSNDRNLKQQKDKGKQIINDILSKLTNSNGNTNIDIQYIINKYTQSNNIFSKEDISSLINDQPTPSTPTLTPLPTLSIPINLTPLSLSFYNTIHLQVSLSQTYLTNLPHNISMNSLSFYIPIINSNNFHLGKPIQVGKNLILTDRSFKSYFKVLIVVIIAIGLYFAVKIGYKKYMKRKAMEYVTDNGDMGMDNSNSNRNMGNMRNMGNKISIFNNNNQQSIKENQISNSMEKKHVILNEEK